MHGSAVSQHGVHESAVSVNHNAQPADYFPTLPLNPQVESPIAESEKSRNDTS